MKILTGFRPLKELNSYSKVRMVLRIPNLECHGNLLSFASCSVSSASCSSGVRGMALNASDAFMRRLMVRHSLQPCESEMLPALTDAILPVPIPLEISVIRRF